MSLATRCPTCQTAFRVVQDQLRVSDGWVRCGRCDHVFNALEGLFDLDHVGSDAGSARGAPQRESGTTAGAPADPLSSMWPSTAPPMVSAPAPTPEPGAWRWGAARTPPEQRGEEGAATGRSTSATADPPSSKPPPPTSASTSRPLPRRSSFFSFSSGSDPAEEVPEFTAADVLDSRFFRSTTEDDEPDMRLDVNLSDVGRSPRQEPSLYGDEADTVTAGSDEAAAPTDTVHGTDEGYVEDEVDHVLIGDAEREAAAEAAAFRLDAASAAESSATDAADDTTVRMTRPGRSEREERGRRDKSERSAKRRRRKDTVPTFVRQADRARRWESPGMQLLLGMAALLLSLSLAVQAVVIARDQLSARWPAAQPWIARLCMPLGCDISPIRRVQDLAIDSSAFTKAETSVERYLLSLVVRNRGALTVATPAIELTLLDAREMVVVRRVLTPEDFSVPASLRAGGTQALNLTLDANDLSAQDLRIAGYRVLAFYP